MRYFTKRTLVRLNSLLRFIQMKQSSKKNTTKKENEEMLIVDPTNINNQEVGYGGDWINIKTSTVVKLNDMLVVQHDGSPITLMVEIKADFNSIPTEYHEVFLNVMSSRYLGKVNFGDNPFSQCKPVQKRKWYQFWKSKYFVG